MFRRCSSSFLCSTISTLLSLPVTNTEPGSQFWCTSSMPMIFCKGHACRVETLPILSIFPSLTWLFRMPLLTCTDFQITGMPSLTIVCSWVLGTCGSKFAPCSGQLRDEPIPENSVLQDFPQPSKLFEDHMLYYNDNGNTEDSSKHTSHDWSFNKNVQFNLLWKVRIFSIRSTRPIW